MRHTRAYYDAKRYINFRVNLAIFEILTPIIIAMLPPKEKKTLVKMAKPE